MAENIFMAAMIVVAVVGVLGFCVAIYLLDLFLQRRRMDRVFDATIAENGGITVLIATLLNDEAKGRQTDRVVRTLQKQPGITVRRTEPPFPEPDRGEPPDDVEPADLRWRVWFEAQDADLLIRGGVRTADSAIALRLLTRREEPGSAIVPDPLAEETITLPADFGKDFATALVALILAVTYPRRQTVTAYLATRLPRLVDRLAALLRRKRAPFAPGQSGDLHYALAVAAAMIGRVEDDPGRLRQAAIAFRVALKGFPRERTPLRWAACQFRLGNALLGLDDREDGTDALGEAVAAYREALGEYTREAAPGLWATIQENLGGALVRLGQRVPDSATLRDAVTVLREALQGSPRDRGPLSRAAVRTLIGAALSILGEREADAGALEGAVAAYREALTEATQERNAGQWASTQYGLGVALCRLGKIRTDGGTLKQAVDAFRAALNEWNEDDSPYDWAKAQLALGKALTALGAMEDGTETLHQAGRAYGAAVDVLSPETTRDAWITAYDALGRTHRLVAAREDGPRHLELAARVYIRLIEELDRDAEPREWAAARLDLAEALVGFAERDYVADNARQAILACGEALPVLEEIGSEDDVVRSREVSASAERLLQAHGDMPESG